MRRLRGSSRVALVLLFSSLAGVPSADGYIVALGGAVNIGDQGRISLLQALAQQERQLYEEAQPSCALFYVPQNPNPDYILGDGFTFIPEPTGPFIALPDWAGARAKLIAEIEAYFEWRDGLDPSNQGCPEQLHLAGFSDGGSTIASWLNLEVQGTWPGRAFGLMALIDVVRRDDCTFPCLANTDPLAEYEVDTLPADATAACYLYLRNQSPLSGCPPLQEGWVGYIITTSGPNQWIAPSGFDPYEFGVCHEDFPPFTLEPMAVFLEQATLELIKTGGCSCPFDCPADLNGDGEVNAADLAMLLGSWGPHPGNPADLNADDQVNAADLALLLGAWGPCP